MCVFSCKALQISITLQIFLINKKLNSDGKLVLVMLAVSTLGKRWMQLSYVGGVAEPSECELKVRTILFFRVDL